MSRRSIPNYDPSNRAAAHVILGAPEKYRGGLLDWALLWVKRHGMGTPPPSIREPLEENGLDLKHGSLFDA